MPLNLAGVAVNQDNDENKRKIFANKKIIVD